MKKLAALAAGFGGSKKRSQFDRRESPMPKFRLSTFVTLSAVVALAIPAAASSNIPGEGGPVWACGNADTTPSWSHVNELYSPACWSNQSSFYAWQPNAPTYCAEFGYRAQVWHVDANNNYHLRYDNYFCRDGYTHWTGRWGYLERRFNWMRINAGGVDWAMNLWRS